MFSWIWNISSVPNVITLVLNAYMNQWHHTISESRFSKFKAFGINSIPLGSVLGKWLMGYLNKAITRTVLLASYTEWNNHRPNKTKCLVLWLAAAPMGSVNFGLVITFPVKRSLKLPIHSLTLVKGLWNKCIWIILGMHLLVSIDFVGKGFVITLPSPDRDIADMMLTICLICPWKVTLYCVVTSWKTFRDLVDRFA